MDKNYVDEPERDETHFDSADIDITPAPHEVQEDAAQRLKHTLPSVQGNSIIENRQDSLARLVEIRTWFTLMEPSSPVIVLLQLTESMVGKRFTELMKILPSELINKIDSENT